MKRDAAQRVIDLLESPLLGKMDTEFIRKLLRDAVTAIGRLHSEVDLLNGRILQLESKLNKAAVTIEKQARIIGTHNQNLCKNQPKGVSQNESK